MGSIAMVRDADYEARYHGKSMSASIMCKEAVMCLLNRGCYPKLHMAGFPHLSNLRAPPRPGVYYANFVISDEDFTRSLEFISVKYIAPCMAELGERLKDVPLWLGTDAMEIPRNVDDGANEHWREVGVRTLVDRSYPLMGETGLWYKEASYYDIAMDQRVMGPCTNLVHFTVHEVGAATHDPTFVSRKG